MRKLYYLIPVAVFLVLALFFLKGLSLDPHHIPSVLIDRPVPQMALQALPGHGDGSGLTTEDLKGKVSLVNIFGSWCISCVQEHPVLMQIAATKRVPIYGIDWRDEPEKGAEWLRRHGDPYTKVGADPAPGRAAIDFGVTGAPESFIVDRGGIIRYKLAGPITPRIWQETLLPIIEHLEAQP